MPINEAQQKEIVDKLKKICQIFEEKNPIKTKLEKIVKNRADNSKYLNAYLKLFETSKTLNTEFKLRQFLVESVLNRLDQFYKLIENTLEHDALELNTIRHVEVYLLSIRRDYKLIRDEMQSLEDLNIKINKWLVTRKFNKIGELLERAVYDKMPGQIVYLPNGQAPSMEKKIEVVKKFYVFFINHCYLLRADIERNLNDAEYRNKIQGLQSILLKKQPNDIKNFFEELSKIDNKAKNFLETFDYTQEILMEWFCKDLAVQIFASNNSDFFTENFVAIFANELFWKNKFWPKFFENFCYIILNFNSTGFKKFASFIIENVNNNKVLTNQRSTLIDQIYNRLADFYRSFVERQTDKFASTDNSAHFRMELYKSNCLLLLTHVESLVKMLNVLGYLGYFVRGEVITEKNVEITIKMLQASRLYGACARELDFNLEPLDVRYFFSQPFLELVTNHQLMNVNRYGAFVRLVFYICAYDFESPSSSSSWLWSSSSSSCDFKKLINFFNESQLLARQAEFETHLNYLIEFLQILIKIGTLELRFKCACDILDDLKSQDSSSKDDKAKQSSDKEIILNEKDQVNVKVLAFFYLPFDKLYMKKLVLRLAETLQIHLLKYLIKDTNKMVNLLSQCNVNFNQHRSFDTEKDLVQGFGIPYYLTANMHTELIETLENTDLNQSDRSAIYIILFRVFTCNSSYDKKEFLSNKKSYVTDFNELGKTVCDLKKFYDKQEEEEENDDFFENDENDNKVASNHKQLFMKYYAHLKKVSFESIADGFKDDYNESLAKRKLYADKIIKNFLNYDLEHIKTIIRSTRETNVEESYVVKRLSSLMRRNKRSLHEWIDSTSSICRNIDFLHFYYKYSQTEFDQWFKQDNRRVSLETMEELKSERTNVIESFTKFVATVDSFKINHLQHNQAGALTLIYNELRKNKNANVFMKLGTGQGKSLIIAETVRKLFEVHGKSHLQVLVLTCYNHLAKRDYMSFVDFYRAADLTSTHCLKNSSWTKLKLKNVIYAELNEFFSMLRNESANCIIRGQSFEYPDFKNAVLILDEFDSLILDSDEINQSIINFPVKATNLSSGKTPVTENVIKQCFGGNEFMNACNKQLDSLFSCWYKSETDKMDAARRDPEKNKTKTEVTTLGIERHYVGSFLDYLANNGQAQMLATVLCPLSFFKQFKQIIGFSGSIDEAGMSRFSSLFGNAYFYDIPPFYGKKRNDENRKRIKKLIVSEQSRFVAEIVQDVKERCLSQPVLIFAETEIEKTDEQQPENKSDFSLILEALKKEQKLDSRLAQCQLLNVLNEDDVENNLNLIGYAKTITIASRVIARGADILVYKDVKQGLHLVISYLPKRKNIFVQMIGRTARQDQLGTYSIIVKKDINYDEQKLDEITINTRIANYHELSLWFYKKLDENRDRLSDILNVQNGLKWPFLLTMLYTFGSNKNLENLKTFVSNNILK